MTPKERAAMQQALEALEELHYSSGTVVAVRMYESATAALREALEQPDEIDWIETNKALAKEIIELKKQTEQEPVAIEELAWEKYCEDTAGDMDVRDFWEELPKSVQQQYIAKVSCSYPNCNCPFDHPGGDWCAKGLSTNATPVRTKDLTDDDLRVCFKATNTSEPLAEGWPGLERFARAVIAADRELNK